MKNPLSYQSTEYDCGPTSLINAINFLFQREEISPDVIRNIILYCLDSYNKKGEAHKNGTTRMAMEFLANWLNQFGRVKKWPIYCEMMGGESVSISQNSRIAECLGQGGAVVARVMYGCWHYILLTGMDQEYIYVFDPYFRVKTFTSKGIEMVTDAPLKMNRKIKYEVFNSEGAGYYALGKAENRECMLLFNNNTRKTMDSIEYII